MMKSSVNMNFKRGIVIFAFLAATNLSGCAGYKPKEFTADDPCRDCPPGGLFSGPDGVFTIYGTPREKTSE